MDSFEWDPLKDLANQEKHGIAFDYAQEAFLDPDRVIISDLSHSYSEERFFCMGRVSGRVVTVRFTWREDVIRIIGAGIWRKGRRIYEKANSRR